MLKQINKSEPAVWFPAVRAGTGTDIYTETLVKGLLERGIPAEITWLPHRTEYAPWTVTIPTPPNWANIVHVNTWLHTRFLPKELPIVSTMHLCVHDPALTSYKSTLQKLYHQYWIKPIETFTIHKSSAVVAVSRYTSEQTVNFFNKSNINVIYNGIDHKDFTPSNRITPHEPFRLLFVGNWSARKGVDLLAPIMTKLGSGFELLYTGTHKTHLPSNTRCIGSSKSSHEMVQMYQSADALLFPTRLEGFGLVALEAQACGIPVIATRSSSLPEVISDGETGILCPQDDIPAFVEAARHLAENQFSWQQMGRVARERTLKLFDEKIMISSYLNLYNKLLHWSGTHSTA